MRKRLIDFWRWYTAPNPGLIPSLITAAIAVTGALVLLRLIFG